MKRETLLTGAIAVFLCWANSVQAQTHPASVLDNVRLQMLPVDIHNVYAGPDGRIWLSTSDVADVRWKEADAGIDDVKKCIEAEFGKPEPRIPASIRLVLFEPKGRVWFKCAAGGQGCYTLMGYDGKQWACKTLMPAEQLGCGAFMAVPPEQRPEVNVESLERQYAIATRGVAFFLCEVESPPCTQAIWCFDGDGWRRQELGKVGTSFLIKDNEEWNLVCGQGDERRIMRLENLTFTPVDGNAKRFDGIVSLGASGLPAGAPLTKTKDGTVFRWVGTDILAYRPGALDNRAAIQCETFNTAYTMDTGGNLFAPDPKNQGMRRYDGRAWVHIRDSEGAPRWLRAGEEGYAVVGEPLQLLTPERAFKGADTDALITEHPAEMAKALQKPSATDGSDGKLCQRYLSDEQGNIWRTTPSGKGSELSVFSGGKWISASDAVGEAVSATMVPDGGVPRLVKPLKMGSGRANLTIQGQLLPPVMCETAGVKRVFALTVLGLQEFAMDEKGALTARRNFAVDALSNGIEALEWSAKGFLVLKTTVEDKPCVYIFKPD